MQQTRGDQWAEAYSISLEVFYKPIIDLYIKLKICSMKAIGKARDFIGSFIPSSRPKKEKETQYSTTFFALIILRPIFIIFLENEKDTTEN